jgi:hypothetical protein
MANMTPVTEAAHIGEVWVDDVIKAEEFSFEFTPRVFRDWKWQGFGETYRVPRMGNITAATKAYEVAWTPTAYVDSQQQLVINKHDVAGFQIEDITAVLAKSELKTHYQQAIGYALGRNLETNLAAVPQGFSQTVGSLGQELTYDQMLEAWTLLARAGVSLTDDCTWLLSPGAVQGLLKQDIFINANYKGPEAAKTALERAQVGSLLGAPIIQTLFTRAPAAGQSESAIFKKNAIALVHAQEVKIVNEYIAKELSSVVGGHQIYGYVEVTRYPETPGSVTAGDDWAVLLNTIA